MMFNWIPFLSYAVITAVTPGPNNIMSMTHAGRVGVRRSLPFNVGILVGFSVVMLGCTFFCNTMSELIPAIEEPMRFVGAAYLLWLSWQTFQSDGVLENGVGRSGFMSGLVLQFINPKIYLYCLISMELYILPYYQGQGEMLTFFAMVLAGIGFLFTLCWAWFGALFKKIFLQYGEVINAIMSMLLAGCAISLFL